MHRFIPALAVSLGGARTCEIPVRHHARRFGESKYGLSRIGKVILDLMVIKMIRSGRETPLIFFGSVAALAGLASALLTALTLILFLKDGLWSVILPSLTVLSLGLAVHLVMLGIITENALHQHRGQHTAVMPMAVEAERHLPERH
jgi:hypothetical protein